MEELTSALKYIIKIQDLPITDWIMALFTIGIFLGTIKAAKYAKKAARDSKRSANYSRIQLYKSELSDIDKYIFNNMLIISNVLDNIPDFSTIENITEENTRKFEKITEELQFPLNEIQKNIKDHLYFIWRILGKEYALEIPVILINISINIEKIKLNLIMKDQTTLIAHYRSLKDNIHSLEPMIKILDTVLDNILLEGK